MLGETILHYAIREKLGEGGMGVVYKAQDTKLRRDVALKFLPTEIARDGDERKRFMIEAQAAAALSHPNIATIHAIEDGGENAFIVMEFVAGDELKQRLKAKPFTPAEALEIATRVAMGLEAAHAKGVVHRDIKPANIMLTPEREVKIMDFGVAKIKDAKTLVTRAGTTVGTWAYMSPEQAQAVPADHRCDLWSLGVVLYETLTGELPFKAEREAGWIHAIVNEQPVKPSSLDRRIPPAVDDVVSRLLEKDRDARYQSASEVRRALEAASAALKEQANRGSAKAIAVLPFENISREDESDYFSDGLAEELIMNLSRLKDIRVVSRTTSMQYKGTQKGIKTIGRELGVRYVVEGSVRRFQDRLRITAQLIDVETDAQLWAETYKGEMADVFDIQETVSKQIVDALMVKLTPTEKVVLEKRATLNAEAFDCQLRARDFLYRYTRNNMDSAIRLFRRAIELDPRYAAAHAGLGEAHAFLYAYFERDPAFLEKGTESALKALLYDSNSSEAYAALGAVHFYKRSLDEAVTAAKKAIDLDEENYVGNWILGRLYHTMGRNTEAEPFMRRVVELKPDFYTIYADLRLLYTTLGEQEKLREALEQAKPVYEKYLLQNPDDARARIHYAIALATLERPDEARAEAKAAMALNPSDSMMLYNAACFYSMIGDADDAVGTLERAVANGFEDYEWMQVDSDLDTVRPEPRFQKLLRNNAGSVRQAVPSPE